MRALINSFLAVLMAIGITVVAQLPAAAAPAAPSARHKVARVCPDNGKKLVCYAIRQTDTVQPAALAPNVFPNGFGPADLRSAYNLTATGSASMTVAVIDAWDDPKAETDLATYRSTFGLPACTTANGCFRKVNQSGQASPLPSADAGWAGEISLDLDMVSAICPGCRILLVEAKSPTVANLGTAVNTAVGMGAKFVSNSYGGSENGSENSYDNAYYNHPGVVITASSGDNGYGVSYPASGKGVTAVGGTTLVRDTSPRGWSETAWSGAGSGCSGSVAAPAFQSGLSTGCSKRAEADVAAVADPQSGVAVYQTYGASGWSVYGGTSAAAPIIAGVYALAGNPGATDSANAYPYAHRSGLNDVTSGSNGTCGAPLCTAGAGYDGPTGLGTPIGTSAFTATSTTPPTPVTVTNPGTRSGPTGTAVTLQMSASGGTAPYTWVATGLPTGLSINTGSGLISGTPTATGTFTVTVTAKDATAATGATTFTWTIGAAGCNSAGQKLTNPGFESGATSWTATSGVIGQPGASEPARTGTWDAWLDGYGTTHTDTLSQTVTIPTGCASYTLSFWLHVDTQETTTTAQNDKLTVTLGATTLATYSNLNKATGYVQKTFNVAALAGQTVTLKFTGTENSSRRTSFVIDDTALTVG
jgi:hypothetical protein